MKKIYLTPMVKISKIRISTCLMAESAPVNMGFGPTSNEDLTPESKKHEDWETLGSEW